MGSIKHDWASEPIAIIGLSCKFGGDATNTDKLWKMLAEGRSAWSEIPTSRLNSKGSYHPNHEKLGTMHVKGGHFLEEDIGLFDAPFFNYSAETAASLDPQYRLQLESVYEALENAGLPLDKVAGSNTSVFAGVFFQDYRDSLIRDEDNLPRLFSTGTGAAMASNRISHFFDLRGASMTVDTGCSTTLVALHQAVQSLRTGEAEMSIIGGSNLLINADNFKTLGSIGFLSPDGKSFAFDSRANGYGRGEGVATIVIKRLRDAIAAGDPIRAVIRETLLNQDGKSETITTPSQEAQEALMRTAYRNAGLNPLDTSYFEAHGTGTPTGDPIEARAIATVLGSGRSANDPLLIGSIKTNVGHTESTSGLASVIKVTLALEKGMIPPSINFEKPNANLDLVDWHLKVATELKPWPVASNGIMRASINNFGYGGTNAHVIMEHRDCLLRNAEDNARGVAGHKDTSVNGTLHTNGIKKNAPSKYKAKVFVVSARDEETCQKMVSNLKEFLEQQKSVDEEVLLQSLAYTLAQRRTRFSWVAAHSVAFTRGIDVVIKALDSPKFKPNRISRRPRIGMIFTGQGAQWHAMGRELIIAYPIFKSSLEEAESYLKALGADWSLIAELSRDPENTRVNETGLSIPICVALQISLVRLLRAWGIMPTAVTSHSSGEIAAAYTVGAISYKAAMATAYYRSVLAADNNLRGPKKGGMIAVGLGLEDTEVYLGRLTSGNAVAACINSPSSVTVAGDISAIQEIEAMAKSDSVFSRLLKVDIGYHSHQMEPLADPYRKALESEVIEQQSNVDLETIAFSSPVTGGRMTSTAEIVDKEHWVASLVQPVQFVKAFTDMVLGDFDPSGSSVDVLIEVGPHAALGGPIRQILGLPEFNDIQLPYFSCLVRNTSALESMQALAASMLCEGYPLNMEAVNFPWGVWPHVQVLTDLPSYPWNHQVRHWIEPRYNKALRDKSLALHELLGSQVPGTNPGAPAWRHTLRVSESPWVRDHVVQSSILYPGAGFICLAIEAVKQMTAIESEAKAQAISDYKLRDIEILQALVVPDHSAGIEIQTKLRPVSDKAIGLKGWMHFEVFSVTTDNRWTQHANGLISVDFNDSTDSAPVKLDQNRKGIAGFMRRVEPGDVFAGLRSVGINHGPIFQNMKSIVQSGREHYSICTFVVADTSVPNDLPRNHVIHPTTLDSVIQAAYTALPGAGSRQESARVPKSIKKLRVSSRINHEAGKSFKAYSKIHRADAQSLESDISVVDNKGDDCSDDSIPVLEVQGLICQSLGRSALPEQTGSWEKELCSHIEWAPDMTLASPSLLNSIKKQLSHSVDEDESSIISDLRRVCIYFIQDALSSLTISDRDQLETHHIKFYKWMEEQIQLASSGAFGPGSSEWMNDSSSERQLRTQLAAKASINGEMVCHLGLHIATMLRREKVPLELMMEDKLLFTYYEKVLKLERCSLQLAALLRRVVHKNPRARILEIGAGTGGGTRHALEALRDPLSGDLLAQLYHFTDISPGFFDAAREKFAPWSDVLAFDRLDIEKDPSTQGFMLESYDIVIAFECLHATKSMANTMANVHSLMKPGGTLLLLETTQDQTDVQFVFGLLPGWWLSEEPERRSSPSLSVPLWDQVLKGAGFTGVDIDIRDCDSDEVYTLSTIMSTALPTQESRFASENIMLVTSNKSGPPHDWLKALQSSIAAGGSLPIVQDLETVKASPTTFRGKICVFIGEVSQPILHNLDDNAFKGIRALATESKGVLWITRGGAVDCEEPKLSLAPGFLRSLRSEYVGRQYITLDLDPKAPLWPDEDISTIVQVIKASFGDKEDTYVTDPPPGEFEYAKRDGTVLIPRCYKDVARNKIVSAEPVDFDTPGTIPIENLYQAERPLSMHVGIPGLLDTLAFGDDPWTAIHGNSLPSDYVEIEPRAYGVNFRDVMVAMGQLNERVMGLECAGLVTRVGSQAAAHGYAVGDRVFGLLRGPFGTRAHIEWNNMMHMPEGLSFEHAASLPVIFSTAYFSLIEIARLQRGQSVLIHAAAGGVGQAAIMLAQHLGAEIFATVGTPDKKALIMHQYGIPVDRIFSSRDTSFAADILAATDGRGVDVVLNSLAGPLLQESFNVLAPFGHFVEIGKRDLELNSSLEMHPFTRHASFSSIDLLAVSRHKGQDVHRVLAEIAGLIEKRIIAPTQPITVYPIGDAATALRLLQTGKHTGKVVLSISPQEKVQVLPRLSTAKLSPHATYLLVGGLGGIGRSVAYWMATHGAKNIIFLSRSAGTVSKKTTDFATVMKEAGCRVKFVSCDVSNATDLTKAMRAYEEEGLPPIRGVIQAAMVLQDSILEKMTLENYKAAILPKVNGSWNLHKQFEHTDLDFFVMLSSIAGIVGYASQSNYSAGGAFEDALAHWRVARSLPAVSIDLGVVKSLGYAAESAGAVSRMEKFGHIALDEEKVLAVLDSAILAPYTPQILVGINNGPGRHWNVEGESQLGRDARFLALKYHRGQQGEKKNIGGGSDSLASKMSAASSRNEAEFAVSEAIAQKLADIFMIPITDIDLAKHPSHYGVDSLVAVELRNMLAVQASSEVSIFGIIQSSSLAMLASEVVAKSRYISELIL